VLVLPLDTVSGTSPAPRVVKRSTLTTEICRARTATECPAFVPQKLGDESASGPTTTVLRRTGACRRAVSLRGWLARWHGSDERSHYELPNADGATGYKLCNKPRGLATDGRPAVRPSLSRKPRAVGPDRSSDANAELRPTAAANSFRTRMVFCIRSTSSSSSSSSSLDVAAAVTAFRRINSSPDVLDPRGLAAASLTVASPFVSC